MNYARWRDVHLWVGLILLLPITVIAATGILWNHEKSLGIKTELKTANNKSAPMRSKTGSKPTEDHTGESTAVFQANPTHWRAQSHLIDSAVIAAASIWGADAALERIELKQEGSLGLVVKVKARQPGMDQPEEIVYSADGGIIARKGDPKAKPELAELVHDLHTGKFFSRNWGFLWSDSAAGAILLLGLSGVVLYVLPILKKRANRLRRAQAASTAVSAVQGHPLPGTAATAKVPAVVRPALPLSRNAT